MKQTNISVVIPVYKNEEAFVKNMKHNLKFLKDCEVIVVNDNPDTTIQHLMKQFADVKLVENGINLGFSGSVNEGLKEVKRPFVMLLNSDVLLHDDTFTKVPAAFLNNPRLFAVSFAQKEKDGSTVGKNKIYWHKGFFMHKAAHNLEQGITAWAEGGAAIFDTQKLQTLAGFDTLYSPFYWEDIDLSYRAWKAGYVVHFDPSIVVDHHHESTIGSLFSKDHVRAIAFRNQFLFIWKNITSFKLLFSHYLYMFPTMLRLFLKRDTSMFRGYMLAVKKSNQIERMKAEIHDEEILALFDR